MVLEIKFLGSLRQACDKETLSIDYKIGSVLDLVEALSKKAPELRRNLLDEPTDEPRPKALILVNGKEISALNGLATKLKDGDQVIFVPVVHGG